jgi:hypothetical protein
MGIIINIHTYKVEKYLAGYAIQNRFLNNGTEVVLVKN